MTEHTSPSPAKTPLSRIEQWLRAYLPLRLRMRLSALRLRGRLEIGHGSHVEHTAQILGRTHVRIGANTCIGARSWLNVNHRTGDEMGIIVGDNCFIGRDNFLSSGRQIVIGDYALTATGCRFIGSTHIVDNPRLPVATTGTTASDVIDIGVNCFFGAGATVLGSVSIGHGSVIGAQSLVLRDVPPFSIAVGNPAKVIKRYSFRRQAWISTAMLDEDDLNDNPGASDYLDLLRTAAPHVPLPWIAAGADMGSF